MTLASRMPLAAFTSFLALSSSSCPPDRFSCDEDDAGQEFDACPVRDFPPVPDTADGAILELAGRGIDPESLHQENLDRFGALTASCSSNQIDRFRGFQEILSDRIAQMPASEIASALESLYRQAYVYDETSHTMALGKTPAHVEAKRRLDLWIAAIDHRAFEDEAFSQKMWDEKSIRTVMALNSPNLDPIHRGGIEQLFRAEARGEEGLREVFRDHPMEGYVRFFDWLQSYDGQKEKYFEDPYFRSMLEANVVIESHFGRERYLKLMQSTFPREAVERLVDERGYGPTYRSFLGMRTEDLLQHYTEVSLAMTPSTRPLSRRRMMEEMMIMGIVFDRRGLDPNAELQRRGIDEMVRVGYSREDATSMSQLQTGVAPYTYDRLDDDQARHGLLEQYRSLYRDLLTLPLDESFSPSNTARYAMWGNMILNRSVMKTPILLEDLDRIRREVQAEESASLGLGPSGYAFDLRDRDTPQWYTPADLGLCGSISPGPLVTAGLTTFDGRSANDLICNNVELMAFLPESLHQDHALATALGVFGVITVRNTDSTVVAGHLQDIDWTPGPLLETLTHESSHIAWFRENFDRDSQRLPMSALNERRAYATGRGYLEAYDAGGLMASGEAAHVDERLLFMNDLISVTNDTVGIGPDQQDPDYWDSRWDDEPLGSFLFQPPDILNGRRTQEMIDRAFASPTAEDLASEWTRLFAQAESDLNLSPAERQQVDEAARQIESSSNDADSGLYFLRSHPYTRVVNEIGRLIGQWPTSFIDVSSSDWKSLQASTAYNSLNRQHWMTLQQSPRPKVP